MWRADNMNINHGQQNHISEAPDIGIIKQRYKRLYLLSSRG